jgi:hypothetical protein
MTSAHHHTRPALQVTKFDRTQSCATQHELWMMTFYHIGKNKGCRGLSPGSPAPSFPRDFQVKREIVRLGPGYSLTFVHRRLNKWN